MVTGIPGNSVTYNFPVNVRNRRLKCFYRLTPELNPSAQRCLTRFLLGVLLLETGISLIYALKTNKWNIHFINYVL
jgi:hypothetical protein